MLLDVAIAPRKEWEHGTVAVDICDLSHVGTVFSRGGALPVRGQ
jgi:hypothetical protein